MWRLLEGLRVTGMAMSSSTNNPLDSLLDLACRDGVDIRPTLLRVITDLYIQKPTHSGEEETRYVELALGLIDAVDVATRATVAARLGAYPAAPQIVLRKLGVVPAPVAAEAPPAAFVGYPAPDLIEEFFCASAGDRQAILTNLSLAEPADHPPPAAADTINQLERAARQHNTREFIRVLGRALSITAPLAARIVEDASGEPIVVAAKALGMKAAVLQRILLVLNPVISQSVERVFNLALLYDEISVAAAMRMVALWRTAARLPRSRHAPLYWDDERTRARAAPTPARHHDARGNALVPPRTRSNER
jgi:uncharacterized protein (DUF2336 family)